MRIPALFGTGFLACSTALAGPLDAPSSEPANADVHSEADAVRADAARGFRVRLNSDGRLTAKFSGVNSKTGDVEDIDNVRVKLIRNGRIVAKVRKAVNGIVQIDGVQPGTYSLIAISPTGYASAGMQVLPASSDAEAEAGVSVFLVPKADYKTVFAFYNGDAEVEPAVAKKVDNEQFGSEFLSPLRRPTLTLQKDGNAVGQVYGLNEETGENAALANARLAIIRDGKIAAATVTNDEGRYSVTGLTEGNYTIATASKTGFSAFGVEARVAEKVAAADSQGRQFVQFGDYVDPCCCVEHAVICETAIPFEPMCTEVVTETVVETPIVEEYIEPYVEPFVEAPLAPLAPAAPMGGGFGGFGGGVGGGGGFGGGGLLAGAAIGGGLGYLLSENDDDDDRRVVAVDPDPGTGNGGVGSGNELVNGLTDAQLRTLLGSLNDAQLADLSGQLSGATLDRVQSILADLASNPVSPGSGDSEED